MWCTDDQAEQDQPPEDVRGQHGRALVGQRVLGNDAERNREAHNEYPGRQQYGSKQDALTEEQPDQRFEFQEGMLHQKTPPASTMDRQTVTPIHSA